MDSGKIIRVEFGNKRAGNVFNPSAEANVLKETDNPILKMAEKLAIQEILLSESDEEQDRHAFPRMRQLTMTPGKILQALEEDPTDDQYRVG